jgi:hypothetical protein
MRSKKFLITFLVFLSIQGFCFGQEFIEDENWISEIGDVYSKGYSLISYRFDNFTKEDVAKAKQKLKSIKQFAPKDEWEGLYSLANPVGEEGLIWHSDSGFFRYYFYHELRSLDYGKIKLSQDFIELLSDKPLTSNPNKKQFNKTGNKLIKVKFGERHFLVQENRLKDFCERAVGWSRDLMDYSYYWQKREDSEKKVFGLPVLPSEYSHLLRYPIEAKISSVGRKQIIPNRQSTKEYNFDDIHYSVTLNTGKNKNIKIGMNFFVEDLGEWIEIKKVFQKSSIGNIRRDIGENNKEQCWDSEGGSGQVIPCKEIRAAMKAKTKYSELFF